MKKLLFFLSIFSLTQSNAQQNLVLNPSFENSISPINCGLIVGEDNAIVDWRSGSLTTPDLISSLFDTNCNNGISNVFAFNQGPKTGNHCVGTINIFSTNVNNKYREYIRGKLSQDLIPGIIYQIEFYVCLSSSNKGSAGMNNIGLKFINDNELIYQTVQQVQVVPDVNYSDLPIVDRENWTLLSFTYIPTTIGLNAFLIGNFLSDEDTGIQLVDTVGYQVNYLLYDDINIYVLVPIFNFIEEICEGDVIELSNVSDNGVSGSWSPAPNNLETTTYVFTPDNPLLEQIQKTIIVKPNLIPEFDEFGPYCDEIPNFTNLPTISNNGVEGTWSPAFNPNQTSTYTFVPIDMQCNESITKTIVIEKTPTFDPIDPFCEVDLNFSLPTISTNGISGTWSPEFDPYNSQTYTFTRDSGDCLREVTLDVVVYPQLNFDFNLFCDNSEYYIEFIPNNFSLSEITNIQWLINNSSISETGNKINLSDYSNLLQEVNTIEIIFTDSNDCLHTKEIQILGKDFCKIQKGISPNGDGLNEYLDLVSFGGVDLKIFNRYGSVVYEKSNYRNEWKGQSNSGKDLPSGTYFYQIQTKIGEEFTGYIQLTY
ncbi:gliding motility-associated C-terminal domain-containing protein [Paenimyroides tangerinum]|uniref:Gliding motility-associated C-terminal domain-containing protein n=1 Tax=Paenimyroides tangerinum TaxID=2488728 RepID=A0A3P3W7T9_9FLAO|nr:gliding motility-associated C-terminal domain-containing protein [Paenimyroides tangerinum]RRJ91231.1 gliding motility-associated C-terminal domain-containing protein [Paenimyroides tangerinum]